MQEDDAIMEPPCAHLTPKARSCPTTWIAAITIVAVVMGNWRGFVYPCYASGVIFQCGVLLLLLTWAGQGHKQPCTRSRSWMFFAGYAVFSAVTCLWARNWRSSAIGAIPIVFSITWVLLLGSMLRNRDSLRLLGRAIFLAGTLAAALAIYYIVNAGKIGAIEKVMGHRNFLAIFLLPPLLLAIAHLIPWLKSLFDETGTSRSADDVLGLAPAFVIVSVVLMMGTLFLCSSMGAFLGLGMGLLTLYAMNLSHRKRMLLVLAIGVLSVSGYIVLSRPRVMAWLLENHPSQATRWFMWQGCMKMISEHPIVGWGSGMFMNFFADFKPTPPMRYGLLIDPTLHPHNEFFLVAIEGGVIALALYIGALFTTIRRHVTAVDAEPDRSHRVLPWALFAGFVAMTVHGLVSVSLRFWAPSTLYWTLAGVLLAFPAMKPPSSNAIKPQTPLPMRLIKLLLTGIVVVFVGWGVVWSGARAESLVITRVKGQRLSHAKYDKRSKEAARLSRYLPDRIIAMRRRVLTLAKRGNLDDAIALCEALEREAPGLGTTRIVLGELYLQRAQKTGQATGGGVEDLTRAADILKLTIEQNPFNANAHVKFARVAMLLSPRNAPVALEHTTAALEADPEHALAHLTQGMVLAQIGNRQAALTALDQAEALCKEKDASTLKKIRATRARLIDSMSSTTTPGQPNTTP